MHDKKKFWYNLRYKMIQKNQGVEAICIDILGKYKVEAER
jgi:hypothetical protein